MIMTQTVSINLKHHNYPIFIGRENFDAALFKNYIRGQQVMLVSNETVAKLYLPAMQECLQAYQYNACILPDGEIYKTLSTVDSIFNALLKHHHNRDTTILALGGGVIGDMSGFAAATYQRGVDFIQIPTTLLAQVDASIGGKTGVNHPLGKNMIGAFHQPRAVIINLDTLSTLPDREFYAGVAEIIKAALLGNKSFFDWLVAHQEKIKNRDDASLNHMVTQACRIKADIVMQDEKEKGNRALLNLGHTFGHAIETWLDYKSWLHGEAVAAGIAIAADFSLQMQWLKAHEYKQIIDLLEAFHLPVKAPRAMQVDDFLELMQHDKKIHQGKLRFILLKSLGNAVICEDFPPDVLERAIAAHLADA